MSTKLKPLRPLPDAVTEAMEDLRLKMAVDTRTVWNALVALSVGALNEDVQLAAIRIALAYTMGLPVERTEHTVQGSKGGAPGPLREMPLEVLQAIKVLQKHQRESGDGE